MIVILTALELERRAVADRMAGVRAHRLDAGTRFEVGYVGNDPSRRIALAAIGVGTGAAAAITALAITEFCPAAVLFVGVAGGLREWLALGDVVVATRVYSYQGARVEPGRVLARPRSWDAAHALEQAARHVSRRVRWYEGPQPGPSVHFDPIAAGDAVLNDRDSALARWLREHYNDAVAVEMESSGVAHAGHLLHTTPTLTIRGISDFADGAKQVTDNGGSQLLVAGNAAAFACALVGELAVDPGTTARPSRDSLPSASKEQHVRVHNSASGHARVGVQAGVVNGTIRLDGPPPDPAEDRVATAIAAVAAAYHSGRIDQSCFDTAISSLEDIHDTTGIDPTRLRRTAKVLDSLFSRLPDLRAEMATALSGLLG